MCEPRAALPDDVAALQVFGEQHVRAHYAPIVGDAAAERQVRLWWNAESLEQAVMRGLVLVLEDGAELVGVAQRGLAGQDHVIYKLYLAASHRGRGLGRRLVAALAAQLPPGTSRLWVEHLAANDGAARFYEREGFRLQRTEPHAGGDPGQAQVWRVKELTQSATERPS